MVKHRFWVQLHGVRLSDDDRWEQECVVTQNLLKRFNGDTDAMAEMFLQHLKLLEVGDDDAERGRDEWSLRWNDAQGGTFAGWHLHPDEAYFSFVVV